MGVSTMPAVMIRIAATCDAVRSGFRSSSYKPSFIKIKELPHIRQMEKNISQLMSFGENRGAGAVFGMVLQFNYLR
jgi:hypothetical protein